MQGAGRVPEGRLAEPQCEFTDRPAIATELKR
eukprot:SAG22_NODE_4298_length_1312_cov_6.388293_3_plen_31_part_01